MFLFVFGLLIVQSCSVNETLDQHTVTDRNIEFRSSNNFNGQDYFVGVFFGTNAYGSTLNFHNSVNSKFATLSAEEQQHINLKINELVEAIDTDNPDFFNQFSLEIESKDPIRIQTIIGEGSKKIYDHLELLYPGMKTELQEMQEEISNVAIDSDGNIDQEEADTIIGNYEDILSNNILSNNEDNVQAFGFAIVWAVYAAAAVHNTIALTANVAVVGAAAIYLAVTFWGPGLSYSGTLEDPLLIETLISEIAQ